MPDMQSKLISAIEFKYDRDLTEDILDTIESRLLDELDTPKILNACAIIFGAIGLILSCSESAVCRQLRLLAAVKAITASIPTVSKDKETIGLKVVQKAFCGY